MSSITKALTHKQQVMRLYKAAVREIRNYAPEYTTIRLEATIIRDRFEQNRHLNDLRVAKLKLLEGQRELEEKRHPIPFQFSYSPGGISYGREPRSNDFVLDHWHPLEKAQFPDYFAKRVQLKKEYITWYAKTYGITGFNPEVEGHISVGGGDHDDDHHGSQNHIDESVKNKYKNQNEETKTAAH